MCCCSCWPSTPHEGVQGGEQKWGTLCSGRKTGRTGLQIVSGADFMSPILISPHIQRSTRILHGDDCFSWLAEASRDQQKLSIKNYVLDCIYSPFTKITYILCVPPISLEQFLRPIWAAVSWAVVLILLQIKLNSQLSCCALFFKSTQASKQIFTWHSVNQLYFNWKKSIKLGVFFLIYFLVRV